MQLLLVPVLSDREGSWNVNGDARLNLNDVVGSHLDANGVTSITKGAVVGAMLRDQLRGFLKAAAPEKHAAYKAIKYPSGEGSDTPETRRAAVAFVFDTVRDMVLAHYVPTNTLASKGGEDG